MNDPVTTVFSQANLLLNIFLGLVVGVLGMGVMALKKEKLFKLFSVFNMSTNGLEYQDQKRKNMAQHIDLPKADLSRVIGGKKLSIHRIETAELK